MDSVASVKQEIRARPAGWKPAPQPIRRSPRAGGAGRSRGHRTRHLGLSLEPWAWRHAAGVGRAVGCLGRVLHLLHWIVGRFVPSLDADLCFQERKAGAGRPTGGASGLREGAARLVLAHLPVGVHHFRAGVGRWAAFVPARVRRPATGQRPPCPPAGVALHTELDRVAVESGNCRGGGAGCLRRDATTPDE